MRRNSPPVVACWFLDSVVPVPYREALLGDLVEEYALRAESASPLKASRWFWSQAWRSVASVVWSSLRSGDWLISMSIAMGVYIAMGMLKFAADVTISKLLAPEQTTSVVLAPVVFLTTTAIGGWVASRIRRGATIFLALIVMITVVVLIDLKVCTIPVPWWYQFGFLTLGPLAVLMAPAIVGAFVPRDAQPAK
jgi:hypothetical protein